MLWAIGLLGLAPFGAAQGGPFGAAQEAPRPLIVVDVPFFAQSVDLCGGAAAAMVLRYWGVKDIQAEDFAPLVDSKKGGISTGDLVAGLGVRGAIARPIRAEAVDVRHEIANGRPVIALIDGGALRLHYVVIVAWASGRVMYHDPSIGPFRVRGEAEFTRLWNATGGFALVVTPDATMPPPKRAAEAPASPLAREASACDPLVDRSIELARSDDPESGVPGLVAAAEMCPSEARPLSSLAGVRFRQKRYEEAARFARRAAERDPGDTENWRLLGASLYLSDAPRPALAAWSRIDEPRIDRIQIDGLVRTRQDIATAVVGLRPRDVLTVQSIGLAQRRIDQWPSASGGKVIYQPAGGGRADVVASVKENPLIEPWVLLTVRLGGELAAKREGRLRINSPTGRGEALEVGGRFAARLPAAWITLETPRLGGLPGVVSLGALWDRQTYRLDGIPRGEKTVETRSRGLVDWSHWVASNARIELGLGIDRFDGESTFGLTRAGVEFRLLADRAALAADGGAWTGFGDAFNFTEFGGALSFRSSVRPRRLAVFMRLDGRRASAQARRALYPGAGKGPGRAPLLRSTRLVDQGELIGEVFGRGLLHGTAEAEIRIADLALARIGFALFTDWAKPWDTSRAPGPGPSVFAIGAGLRLRASVVAIRVDVAKRPGRSGVLVSAGVMPPWPR